MTWLHALRPFLSFPLISFIFLLNNPVLASYWLTWIEYFCKNASFKTLFINSAFYNAFSFSPFTTLLKKLDKQKTNKGWWLSFGKIINGFGDKRQTSSFKWMNSSLNTDALLADYQAIRIWITETSAEGLKLIEKVISKSLECWHKENRQQHNLVVASAWVPTQFVDAHYRAWLTCLQYCSWIHQKMTTEQTGKTVCISICRYALFSVQLG